MKLILINDQGVQCEVWDTDLLQMETPEEIGERIMAAIKINSEDDGEDDA